MYMIHHWDTNELEPKNFRLGKHEKAILETLKIYHELNCKGYFNWQERSRGYSWQANLADEGDIEDYERGQRVPVWILRRDIGISGPILARALKTLYEKDLIIKYGGDLDYTQDMWKGNPGQYIKYVKLSFIGEQIAQTLTNEKCKS